MVEMKKFREPIIVLFQGMEDNKIICDITTSKARTKTKTIFRKKVVRKRIPARKILGKRLKLDDNPELIEKAKGLKRRRKIYISLLEDDNLLFEKNSDVTVMWILTKDEYKSLEKMQEEKLNHQTNI